MTTPIFLARARSSSVESQPCSIEVWMHEHVSGWTDQRLAERVARELMPNLLHEHRTSDALV
jgi:hypothetical protein